MGNMICRNVDTTAGSTQSCGASQTGALMSYDNEGRLSSWTASGGSTSTPNDQFLYDNSGNRVLQRISNGTSSPTDTISFNGYTDVTMNGGQTSTTKYYTAGGKTVALRKDGVLSYQVPDLLGSVSLILYADGSTESVQLYAPFGTTRYSDGTTPTAYGFTGQRFDSTTSLMYYNARYYDPMSGRFISADSEVTNATGEDPFAYVSDNPETMTDPTGHRLDMGDGDTIIYRAHHSNSGFYEPPVMDDYPLPVYTYTAPTYTSWWDPQSISNGVNALSGYAGYHASAYKKRTEIAHSVATKHGASNNGTPSENKYIRSEAEDKLGKSEASTKKLGPRAGAAESLEEDYSTMADGFGRFGSILCGANFFIDGVSTGMGDYHQHHNVGHAFAVGVIHGFMSTVCGMVGGWAGAGIGEAVGGAIGDVPGGIIGGALGGVVGGYMGGVVGDDIADDWCKNF